LARPVKENKTQTEILFSGLEIEELNKFRLRVENIINNIML
jgi:hypothetical protein